MKNDPKKPLQKNGTNNISLKFNRTHSAITQLRDLLLSAEQAAVQSRPHPSAAFFNINSFPQGFDFDPGRGTITKQQEQLRGAQSATRITTEAKTNEAKNIESIEK